MMTCQSWLGVGEGFAAGDGEALADGLAGDLADDFEDLAEAFALDLAAKEAGPRERQRTPARSREVKRGAFIDEQGAR